MAAFIIAIRGTAAQGVVLGLSAAFGHTIIVWGLALLGLYLGDRLIIDRAEPWLVLVSGLLIIALAARLLLSVRKFESVALDDHGHNHDHGHEHQHAGEHTGVHSAMHEQEIEARFAGRTHVTTGEIVWFGFTGGLLPCPAAIAVLLVCLQLKKFGLGAAMVAAFSLGLAATMVTIGVAAAWGARRAARSWSGFDRWATRIPYISGALVMSLGLFITMRGLFSLGVFGAQI